MIVSATARSKAGRLLTRLTYVPKLQAIARFLGLRGLFRKVYYRLAVPRDGNVAVSLGGVSARFRAHTPLELRIIEAGGGGIRVLTKLISVLRKGDVLWDIGASIGLYTALPAKAVGPEGQVVAFEPDSENYAKLRENVELNGLTNVRLVQKALGETKARMNLYKGADITDSNLRESSKSNSTGCEAIEMVDGDTFREDANLPPPRAIKIDVEGYEYAVLQGLHRTLAMPNCELVFCEIHPTALPAGVSTETILSFLRTVGFSRTESDVTPGYPLIQVIASKVGAGAPENKPSKG